jgi:hypothetical protein
VIGAAVGRAFDDERGGVAQFGAFLGALASPVLVIAGLIVYGLVCWMAR